MSIRLSALQKVRCRVIDEVSGRPLGGLVATLLVGSSKEGAKWPVATLCSDATGYLSFDLQSLVERGLSTVAGLWLALPQAGIEDIDLLASSAQGDSAGDIGEAMSSNFGDTQPAKPVAIEFPVRISTNRLNPAVKDAGCLSGGLSSIQRPDAADYRLSPYSFVTPPKARIDGDCCETLAPSTMPVEEHGFYRVVVRRKGDASPPIEDNVERAVSILGELPPPRTVVKFADVLEYRQRWFAIGHSLGEIKYSLPLAPGESTQLAVIEWSRQDSAARRDAVTATEVLEHDLKRDRAIEESIDSGLKESQSGWSWTGGLSSGMAYDAKAYGQYTGNWAAGGGTSNSSGSRTLKADSLQDLHDHVNQSSSSVRSLTSTVIVQASQAEQNLVQTRRVANHNHCHAMTIQYYEVLRHFRLVTEYVRQRSAVLVPFAPFRFTRGAAIRFRTLLERALLDRNLLPFFDALLRLNVGDAAYLDPPVQGAPVVEPKSIYYSGSLNDLTVNSRSFPMYPREPNSSQNLRIQKGSTITVQASGSGIKFRSGDVGSGYGPDGESGRPAPDDGTWPMPGAQSYALLAKVGNDFNQVGFDTTFVAKNEGVLSFWFNDTNKGDNSGSARIDFLDVQAPQRSEDEEAEDDAGDDAAKTPVAKRVTKASDGVRETFLLEHLNGNVGYYNRAIWFLMDPSERRMYLEAALGADSGLISVIDDKPIASSGSHIAFYYNVPDDEPDNQQEVDPTPVESIVTLPTRGLFAEAQLGHCNSCEKRDATRMWNWTEMTTEEPPAIAGIEPGPQGGMPNLQPTPMPSNVIQITQPQNAPDPTALANALTVLRTPEIFRDMSGLDQASALLGKLADGTVRTLEGMLKGAAAAKEKVDAARSGQPASNGGNTAAPSAANLAEKFSLLPEIKTFAKDLGLTDAETRNFALDQIYGTTPNTRGGGDANLLQTWGMSLSEPGYAAPWRDLIQFQPTQPVMDALTQRNLSLQVIDDGRAELNLDNYPVLITQLPNKPGTVDRFTAGEFFEYIRRSFSQFLQVYPRTGRPLSLDFYQGVDATQWNTNNPLASVLEFYIDALPFSWWLDSSANSPVTVERGLVVCSEYVYDEAATDFHWNFCTVRGPVPIGFHPVCGTRQFGIGLTQDGLAFYVRGADRPTTPFESAAGPVLIWGQEEYWETFRSKIIREITRLGGAAELGERNSMRFNWPSVRSRLYSGGITA